jgi:hypothetical protein
VLEAKAAASQFLRAARGKRSQVAFARRLGYRGNPITDWEHGRRYPTAAEALRACARASIDVRAALRRFHPTAQPAGAGELDGDALAGWLSQLRGWTPLGEIGRRCGCSRFAVARWLSGQGSHPRRRSALSPANGRSVFRAACSCPRATSATRSATRT